MEATAQVKKEPVWRTLARQVVDMAYSAIFVYFAITATGEGVFWSKAVWTLAATFVLSASVLTWPQIRSEQSRETVRNFGRLAGEGLLICAIPAVYTNPLLGGVSLRLPELPLMFVWFGLMALRVISKPDTIDQPAPQAKASRQPKSLRWKVDLVLVVAAASFWLWHLIFDPGFMPAIRVVYIPVLVVLLIGIPFIFLAWLYDRSKASSNKKA